MSTSPSRNYRVPRFRYPLINRDDYNKYTTALNDYRTYVGNNNKITKISDLGRKARIKDLTQREEALLNSIIDIKRKELDAIKARIGEDKFNYLSKRSDMRGNINKIDDLKEEDRELARMIHHKQQALYELEDASTFNEITNGKGYIMYPNTYRQILIDKLFDDELLEYPNQYARHKTYRTRFGLDDNDKAQEAYKRFYRGNINFDEDKEFYEDFDSFNNYIDDLQRLKTFHKMIKKNEPKIDKADVKADVKEDVRDDEIDAPPPHKPKVVIDVDVDDDDEEEDVKDDEEVKTTKVKIDKADVKADIKADEEEVVTPIKTPHASPYGAYNTALRRALELFEGINGEGDLKEHLDKQLSDKAISNADYEVYQKYLDTLSKLYEDFHKDNYEGMNLHERFAHNRKMYYNILNTIMNNDDSIKGYRNQLLNIFDDAMLSRGKIATVDEDYRNGLKVIRDIMFKLLPPSHQAYKTLKTKPLKIIDKATSKVMELNEDGKWIEVKDDVSDEVKSDNISGEVKSDNVSGEVKSDDVKSLLPKLTFTPSTPSNGGTSSRPSEVSLTSFDNAMTSNNAIMRKMIYENNMKMFPRKGLDYNKKMAKLRVDMNKNVFLKGNMPLSAWF